MLATPSKQQLRATASASSLSGSATGMSGTLSPSGSVRRLANPNDSSIVALLHQQHQRKEQQKMAATTSAAAAATLTPQRSMLSSASTPGLRQTVGLSPPASPLRPLSAASSGAATPQQQQQQQRRGVQFTPAAATPASPASLRSSQSMTILPPMSPNAARAAPSVSSSATATAAVSPSEDALATTDEVDEMDVRALTLGSGSELNLAEGLDLLHENLLKLVPNSLLKSAKYKGQVEQLLAALRIRANQAYIDGRARKVALEAALAARRAAETSEHRYRSSISNLELDSWGSTDQLAKDIHDLEREIVERGRLTVEDHESVSTGLQFGIENVDAASNATSASASASGSKRGSLNGSQRPTLSASSMLSTNATPLPSSMRDSTSKLVFTKFKRLEQLIYLLKRKLAALENYPHRREIDATYGGMDALLARVRALEGENARLESRLDGQACKFKEEALLRVRDLTACPPALLHLLVVGLQTTLASYMRAVDECVGAGKDFANAKHPLHHLVKAWTAEVEREARRLDVAPSAAAGNAGASKRSSTAGALVPSLATATAAAAAAADKIDIDELWERMVAAKNGGAALGTGTGTAVGTISEVYAERPQKVRGQSSGSAAALIGASAAASASAASAADLAAQLSAASLRIRALEVDNETLEREVRSRQWMEDVLRREGITAATASSDAQQREEERAALASDAADSADAGVDVARTPVRARRPEASSSQEEKEQRSDATTRAYTDDTGDLDAPTTPLRSLITITAPTTSSAESASAARASAGTTSGASPSVGGGGGVSSLSRSLLRHLDASAVAAARYRRFVREFQQLHVSRENALAAAEKDKQTATRVLMHLLAKHPQLIDAQAAGGRFAHGRNLGEQMQSSFASLNGSRQGSVPGSRNMSARSSSSGMAVGAAAVAAAADRHHARDRSS